ncbi:MBL fold metallo-hydrolase [Vibrio parahaemolyticus]|uniref:MBL fold metallo-hydrolase n=1 Tax=Vibrio parahaemolyticus TaxID=670 RepID=UPI0009B6BFD5|nr:MBL fold metallo-hydrolase [Vibrio parahaemolyticus]EGQ8061908.1 MBL fold metallo-hydrolase [Vibrio parahaemolyticus]EHH1251579.1 MBL fold metallo-hydrolase [Vibrio parahaemolyticus]EHW0633238.1 MBL fold metallo-hydrolase [Vibrio parahaemolyticus]EJA3305537.1 MBL fold metallo-hydrolase [Vibrio parahaemolyticus]EJG0669535.1 MBL fold metallo-hydrolase [Vibrio parahaemolyticus]
MKKLSVVLLLLVSVCARANEDFPEMSDKNGYVEPFQMFDDVYYVGDKWVSSYAVETNTGLVIIDTLDFPYSKWIPINLKKLGLEKKPVTHILATHGHSDHVGGAQYLQAKYGSKVVMTSKGHELAKTQAVKSEGSNKFLPPNVDLIVKDGMTLEIGGKPFKFYITPGHTEGDFSLDFMVQDSGALHRAFVVGGHSLSTKKPELANQFLKSMDRIREIALKPPVVTVNLANHPHKNDLFTNRDKRKNGAAVNPFISKYNFFMFLEQQENLAKEKLVK